MQNRSPHPFRLWAALFLTLMSAAAAPAIIEQKVWSDILQASRTVRVCLPASYESDRSRRYPVLYVQDGQNAFTTAGPHAAFGWGNWELDRTAAQLAREGRMREIIMVAVDCSPSRYREYRGPVPAGLDNRACERYVRFLREELKPRIDREHRTLPDAASTGLLGSSMGGIFALATAWEHPQTFGLAASLSGAFQVEKEHFSRLLATYQGAPKPLRVYLDSGTADYSGGDDGAANTAAVARELRRIGIPLEHFTDRSLTADELRPLDLPDDKFKEAQRSHHNELYWRQRAWRALVYMFPPAKP